MKSRNFDATISALLSAVEKTDSNAINKLIEADATPPTNSWGQGARYEYGTYPNTLYCISSEISDQMSYHKVRASRSIIEAALTLIEKSDPTMLTKMVKAGTVPVVAYCTIANSFYLLASAIGSAVDDFVEPVSKILTALIAKADSESIAAITAGFSVPAVVTIESGMNTFYRLAATIEAAACKKASSAHLEAVTNPLVMLIAKIDATAITKLIDAFAEKNRIEKPRGLPCYQSYPYTYENKDYDVAVEKCIPKNTFDLLVSAIKHAIQHKLSNEQIATVSRPLLMLLEKANDNRQFIAISYELKKAGGYSLVREQLKKYLLQNRENEDAAAKLKRLENYVKPYTPFYTFLSTNKHSIFVGEATDTIAKIRAEIATLKKILNQASPLAINSANFPNENQYSKNPQDDEKKHGSML